MLWTPRPTRRRSASKPGVIDQVPGVSRSGGAGRLARRNRSGEPARCRSFTAWGPQAVPVRSCGPDPSIRQQNIKPAVGTPLTRYSPAATEMPASPSSPTADPHAPVELRSIKAVRPSISKRADSAFLSELIMVEVQFSKRLLLKINTEFLRRASVLSLTNVWTFSCQFPIFKYDTAWLRFNKARLLQYHASRVMV